MIFSSERPGPSVAVESLERKLDDPDTPPREKLRVMAELGRVLGAWSAPADEVPIESPRGAF